MSFIRVNKTSSWELWRQGLVAAGNANLIDTLGTKTILGAGKGLNAIRLWLNYNGDGYWLVPNDYISIGLSGWNQSSYLTVGQLNPTVQGNRTYADTALKIEQVLRDCGDVGIGVILTLNFWGEGGGRMWVDRAADAPQTINGFVLPDPYTKATTALEAQDRLVQFWRQTALRFGANEALIGYDILNEPAPSVPADLASLANRVVTAIRSVDAATPIIVEGHEYGTNLDCFKPTDALITANSTRKVVFSIHAYAPVGSTHNGLADWSYESMGMPYPPVQAWNLSTNVKRTISSPADLIALFYQNTVNFRVNNKVPVFVGEFSYINQGTLAGYESKYYEIDQSSPHRLVTKIQPVASGASNQIDLVMGGLDALGFRIDSAPKALDVFENTVKLTLKALPPELRNKTIPAQSQDTWASIVTGFKIIDQEVTIRRAGKTYTVTLPVGIAAQSIIPTTANAPVALISLKPSAANQLKLKSSQNIFAKHILYMCKKYQMSWAWHAVDDQGEVYWRPNPDTLATLRSAAMGREITI